MKTTIVLLLALASVNCSALQFTGIITGTVAPGQSPVLYSYYGPPGTVWNLPYVYTGDSVDGSFNPAVAGDTHWERQDPRMTVLGGHVTSFSAWNAVLLVAMTWWDFDSRGGGSIAISDPQPLASAGFAATPAPSVPESGNAGLLLGIACVGLLAHRKFTARSVRR